MQHDVGFAASRWPRLFLALALIAVVVSACGSASSSSGGSARSASGNSAASSSAAGPLKIAVSEEVIPGVYNSLTQIKPALKSFDGYVGTHGGWGGRKVIYDQCVTSGDPASDTKCYRQFAANHDVAQVGGLPSQDSIGLSILSKAGIPSFTVLSGPGNASPWQETITGDTTTALASAAVYACARGDRKVSLMTDDLPVVRDAYAKFVAPVLARCGVKVNLVYAPATVTDLAPFVQKAIASHPDLLIDGVIGLAIQHLPAIVASGFPISRTILADAGPSSALFAEPKASGVLLATSTYIPVKQDTNSDVQTYLTALGQYAPGADPLATFTGISFSQLYTVWQASKAIGFNKVTGPLIKDYMLNQAPDHLNVFLARVVSSSSGYPGMKQPYSVVSRWTGTGLVNLGWWNSLTSCNSAASCKALVKMS